MSKPLRLSHTQVSMYLDKCPRQWAFRYLENLKLPPSAAMKRSVVGHGVIEANYRAKALNGADIPVEDLTDMYATNWRAEFEKEEITFDTGETADQVRDEGISAVKEHRLVIAPTVQPASEAAVEEWFDLPLLAKAENPDDGIRYSIVGKIDLTDAAGIIRDNKIVGAKRQVTPQSVASDRQLSIYAMAHRIKTKQPETGVSQDVVRLMKKGPQAITVPGVRTREYLLEELNTIGHVARGIEHHVFPKRTDGWHCSARWCGYWNLCEGRNLKVVDMGQNQSTGETDGAPNS